MLKEVSTKVITEECSITGKETASSNAFDNTVAVLMEASGLDKEISEELVEDFCGQAIKLSCTIKKHIMGNNLMDAGLLLHQLKGSAGNVRAQKIAQYALEAELAIGILDHERCSGILKKIDELLAEFLKRTKEE